MLPTLPCIFCTYEPYTILAGILPLSSVIDCIFYNPKIAGNIFVENGTKTRYMKTRMSKTQCPKIWNLSIERKVLLTFLSNIFSSSG